MVACRGPDFQPRDALHAAEVDRGTSLVSNGQVPPQLIGGLAATCGGCSRARRVSVPACGRPSAGDAWVAIVRLLSFLLHP